jgi:hypothetical protein
MSFLRRSTTSTPDEPRRTGPSKPGAMLFTLRTVPRHYEVLKEAIESRGDARVYFGESLAYIRGKGIALFRVEATGTDFVDPLVDQWKALERREAFRFNIDFYIHNTEWIASLRGKSPEEIKALIQKHAPTFQPTKSGH